MEPLHTAVTFRGSTAMELRRICKNLNIPVSVFVRKAVVEKLERMGVVVR